MAAAVETMMYVGETPWHGEGTYVGDDNVYSKEALVASGLEWGVHKAECYAQEEGGDIFIPDMRAVLRDTDNAYMGMVGKDFNLLQNSEAALQLSRRDRSTAVPPYHCAGCLC